LGGYEHHEVFKRPSEHAQIWRYIDFAKFVDLLSRKALFFARADRMDDPWEASLSLAIEERHLEKITLQLPPGSDPPRGDDYRTHWQALRRRMFLSCWHLSEHQSAAMWGLYAGREGQGIALQSTFGRLERALPNEWQHSIHAGTVSYVDYSSDDIPLGNAFYRCLYKRTSFEHERELRALFATHDDHSPDGFLVPTDLSTLIEKIYVAPTAPPWFTELVKRTARCHGATVPIIPSDLLAGPPSDPGS
jgi:hypothetical protein